MKLLVVFFGTVLVAQLGAVNSFPNDVIEEYQDFQYMENNNMLTEDVRISVRACYFWTCNNFCRSRGFLVGRCISANICHCS
ncbi:unnamed protein product [Arctia plantaginis]|uniref:Defensin n=1 Tax=Arctia plantaginis TaxID=874455 RepID=A0A8S1BEL7_ARCPL|nr:unnamed protein product [Arctia plantaginis]CAB3256767.1 unnamed protein product [Arctia plantaginis]